MATSPNNVSSPVAPQANGPAHGATRGWIARIFGAIFNKWSALVIVVLFVAAWLAGMPSGALRFAMVDDVGDDAAKADVARAIFERVDAGIEAAVKFHRQVSFIQEDGAYDVDIPAPPPHSSIGIEKYLRSASVEAALKEENTSIELKFDIVALIEKTYEWFGLFDYYLVIRGIEPTSCLPDQTGGCWKLIAQFRPSNLHADEFVGTEESLARDLAVFVVRGAARNKGDEWRATANDRNPSFLTEPAIPVTIGALQQTAEGLDILQLGLAHPRCFQLTPLHCIDLARRALTFGTVQARTVNPVSAYGRALIELDAGLRAAESLAPELIVEQHLSNAGALASQASANDFLAALMSKEDFAAQFTLVQLGGVKVDETLITMARRFSCALSERRRARWAGCVDTVGALSDFPAPLQPYIEAALIDANLNVLKPAEAAAEINLLSERVAELAQSPEQSRLTFMLGLVLIDHVCQSPALLGDSDFRHLVQAVLSVAPHSGGVNEAILRASGCRAGQLAPTNNEIQAAVADLEAMPMVQERFRLELLNAEYEIRVGNLARAVDLTRRALAFPGAGAFVRASASFAPIMNGPAGFSLKKLSFSFEEGSVAEPCERRVR
jgi:hypothetical protein